MTLLSLVALLFVAIIFLNIVPYEDMKPYVTRFLKEYQFERLNPNTHHQKAAAAAIAIGGLTGTGWRKVSIQEGDGCQPRPHLVFFWRRIWVSRIIISPRAFLCLDLF